MSKIFTRLYTSDTVASGGGKCFKQLVPDITETWVWNNTLINLPEYSIYSNTQSAIKALRKETTHCVDFYVNGVKYVAIQYFRVKAYGWSGFEDGYTMDGVIYFPNYDPETGSITTDGVPAYNVEANWSPKGWQSSTYKTVTYTSIPKSADLIAFRKVNATKSKSSVLTLSNAMETETNAVSSLMSALTSK